MITENEVVRAACLHLEGLGYTIEQALSTSERGVDIIARRGALGESVLVEAKGGTSSKLGTARHGKEFSPRQVVSHVARAFYAAAILSPDPPDAHTRVVVALPDTPLHRKQTDRVRHALLRLGISVWLVDDSGAVREFV